VFAHVGEEVKILEFSLFPFAPHLCGEHFLFSGLADIQDKPRSAMATKEATVAELTDKFQSSAAILLTEYRGLTVGQLKELRRSISADATYAVAKNTLLTIAAKNAGVTAFEGQLFGPTAMAFVHGDTVAVAKAMRDFAKANPLLVVKNGIMDGVALSADEVKKLADLESREVLLAKAAGMFKASMFKAAYMFQAPLAQAVRTVDALRAKQEQNA
jgi:large subunit ribosomal protein L10